MRRPAADADDRMGRPAFIGVVAIVLLTASLAGPRRKLGALMLLSSPLFELHVKQIADFTVTHRLPAISLSSRFTDAGGLMTYGPLRPEYGRRLAVYVDKILKGAKPGTLPIEQPSTFELVVNLKTAKALGLTLPPPLLARADRVIE